MAADQSRRVATLVALLTAAAATTLVVAVVVTTSHTVVSRTVLSPLYTKNTVTTEKWNGLPEGYHFHPFRDLEHTDDWTTPDPWSSQVSFDVG